MHFDLELFRKTAIGASEVALVGGKYRFSRFSAREGEAIQDWALAMCTAGIRLSFLTDAKAVSLKVATESALPIRSYFSFDIYENNCLLGHIRNFEDGLPTVYSGLEYPLGSFSGYFVLNEGQKKVDILFPHSVIGSIEELELEGANFCKPAELRKTLFAYGDSITQGYDALYPSNTYVQKLADLWDMDLINKGIGGAVFLPKLAEASSDKADAIIVAYGTNDWNACTHAEFREKATAFLDALDKLHPDIPKLVLSPIWRLDWEDKTSFGESSLVGKILEKICQDRCNTHYLSGWELLPHDTAFFGDGMVHPTDAAFEIFLDNLKKQL